MLVLTCFGDEKLFTERHWNTPDRERRSFSNCTCYNTPLCLSSFSPLCCSCIASGATSLNTTKRTVWSPWRCPAWWNTPCSPSCPSVTTGIFTCLPTARPPSCRTTPSMGDWWESSTWERGVVSSTGMTHVTETLMAVSFISKGREPMQCGKRWHCRRHSFDSGEAWSYYASWLNRHADQTITLMGLMKVLKWKANLTNRKSPVSPSVADTRTCQAHPAVLTNCTDWTNGGTRIKGHIFYHHTMSDAADLILMKAGGRILAAFWHLTFFNTHWLDGDTIINGPFSRKAITATAAALILMKCLKGDATCFLTAHGVFELFMRYSMFTDAAVQMCYSVHFTLLVETFDTTNL